MVIPDSAALELYRRSPSQKVSDSLSIHLSILWTDTGGRRGAGGAYGAEI